VEGRGWSAGLRDRAGFQLRDPPPGTDPAVRLLLQPAARGPADRRRRHRPVPDRHRPARLPVLEIGWFASVLRTAGSGKDAVFARVVLPDEGSRQRQAVATRAERDADPDVHPRLGILGGELPAVQLVTDAG